MEKILKYGIACNKVVYLFGKVSQSGELLQRFSVFLKEKRKSLLPGFGRYVIINKKCSSV